MTTKFDNHPKNKGVFIINAKSIKEGDDVVLFPGCHLYGGTSNLTSLVIGSKSIIGANSIIDSIDGRILIEEDVKIGNNCTVKSNNGEIVIKKHTRVDDNTVINADGGKILLFENSYIGCSTVIRSVSGEIKIGARTEVGDHVRIYSDGGQIIVGEDVKIDPDNEIHGKGQISIGNKCHFWSGSYINAFASPFHFGFRVTIGQKCVIGGRGPLAVGQLTMIGGQNFIVTENHGYDNPFVSYRDQGFDARGVIIGEDVWIASACRIIDGVNIGKRSFVGVGTVVSSDIPEYTFYLNANRNSVLKDRRKDFVYNLQNQIRASEDFVNDSDEKTFRNHVSLDEHKVMVSSLNDLEMYLIEDKHIESKMIEKLKYAFRKYLNKTG